MKRKLNESVAGSVKIDVVSLVHDYPELQGNIDKLAKQIEDTTGASVSQDESDDTIYMVIDGITMGDVINIFADEYYIDDIGNKVREDYDIEPCTDDSVIDLEEIATDAQDLLANDDCYYECYWDAIHTAIKQYLKEKGLK